MVSQKRLQSGSMKMFAHKRIWLAHFTISKLEQPSKNTTGFLVCQSEAEPFNHQQGNLFRCPQNELISTMFVLDGVGDCAKQGTSQAGDEMCLVEEFHCPQRCLDNKCNCSPVHYKSKTGECISFLPKDQKQHRDFPQEPQLKKKMFKCNNGLFILSELTDDLFPDCLSGADEPILTNLLKHRQSLQCPLAGQLPCKDGHPKCYSVSDICIYEVNEQHNLIPCRTGENVQSCLKFQCNILFKCPKAYCISWSYVCDGVWNCPFGHDEQETHGCRENRICQHMFKCWKSQVCVHVRETCNFKIDCPSADDEYLCQVGHLQCPISCFCLNLAIYCKKKFSKLIPDSYISYHVILSSIQHLDFLKQNSKATRLHFVRNYLIEICPTTSKLHEIKVANFAGNILSSLSCHCFNNLQVLHHLILKENNLEQIEDKSFVSIKRIGIFDVSGNKLSIFKNAVFSNISRIDIFNVSNNPLTKIVLANMTVGYLFSSTSWVCCIKPLESTCSLITDKGDATCVEIVPGLVLKTVTLVLSILLLLANGGIAFLVHRKNATLDSKTNLKPFNLLCQAGFGGNCACGFYLATLLTSDILTKDNISYRESVWNKSTPCYVAHFLCLFYSLCTSHFLSLISFARLMVILYPLTSSFKSCSSVKKYIFGSACSLAFVSLSVLVPGWIGLQEQASKLCSPFTNPSKTLLNKLVTLSVLIFQVCAGFGMSVIYLMIHITLTEKDKVFNVKRHSIMAMMKVFSLTIFNTSAWVICMTIYTIALFLENDHHSLVVHNTAAVLPIPALCVPLFFLPYWKNILACCRK